MKFVFFQRKKLYYCRLGGGTNFSSPTATLTPVTNSSVGELIPVTADLGPMEEEEEIPTYSEVKYMTKSTLYPRNIEFFFSFCLLC